MKLSIIGKDPVLTLRITQMIGERAARKARASARKAWLLSPLTSARQWLRSR